jgi:hypothetical protein
MGMSSCSLLEVYRSFARTYYSHLQCQNLMLASLWSLLGFLFNPEDGVNMTLWNADELLPDYTVSHPRR